MPLNWRRSIANQLRSNSAVQYQQSIQSPVEGAQAKTNVTLSACAAVLQDQAGNQLIHGHTHLPRHHHERLQDQEWQRWVLSDWDLDHPESGQPRASALLINQDGVRYTDLVKA
jgi:UDP-2,3-diacylglucosamine hydrolase